ncbi:MAG: aspartate dehydrogenase [Rhodospirillaceae bacterium]|nr:aspartate dehydrogenase [Rhodospirillaceae bacterium]MBT5564119.1 aspartate dehydrogenase [Rhodospirillaceae bacterium]MBT6089914.1 aspartate dehydrogenase [Rhodospirillaceae bacterium]MBT7452167.1 aspartate dehydrogenase [Rhodospirillaceae bacterium]
MKIGLIGNGTIARVVTTHCEGSDGRIEIVGAVVLSEDGPSVGCHPTFKTLDPVLAMGPELILECAAQQAVFDYGTQILKAGVDLMVISVGALADAGLRANLEQEARAQNTKVIIPAGALAGLDAITAAKTDGLERVLLRTRKPPNSWAGAPGVEGVDLDGITEPTTIFSGSAGAAARAFPKNANVAAAVALAGIGVDETQVELIADPGVTRNIHHIEAEGAFGRLEIDVQAEPSPNNPKTSHLAALSIVRQLDKLTEPIQI